MKLMNKIFLFTCLAGAAGSMHAFSWQDVQNSCKGLYTKCIQSLKDGSAGVSTKACEAYSSCANYLHKNANEVATNVSTKAANMRDAVVNTASDIKDATIIKVGNLKDATVKVTAPVVEPVVETAKTGANGVVSAAHFTYENPILVGSGTAVSLAAYIAYCRKASAPTEKDMQAINQAEDLTKHMDLAKRDGIPSTSFEYWRYYGSDENPGWMTAADILEDKDAVYRALHLEFNRSNEAEQQFIDGLTAKIDLRKLVLTDCLEKLRILLGKCRILPSFKSMKEKQNNMYVDQVLGDYINSNKAFTDLDAEDIEEIQTTISNKTANWVFNPIKIARRLALPYEALAIKHFWNVYQLLQRLEALQICLKHRTEELNKPFYLPTFASIKKELGKKFGLNIDQIRKRLQEDEDMAFLQESAVNPVMNDRSQRLFRNI